MVRRRAVKGGPNSTDGELFEAEQSDRSDNVEDKPVPAQSRVSSLVVVQSSAADYC